MLNTPSPQSIARSGVLDHCNTLTALTLDRLGLDSTSIRVEAAVRQFPPGLERAIFFGQEDIRAIIADASIQLECVSDGSYFTENEPVLAPDWSSQRYCPPANITDWSSVILLFAHHTNEGVCGCGAPTTCTFFRSA